MNCTGHYKETDMEESKNEFNKVLDNCLSTGAEILKELKAKNATTEESLLPSVRDIITSIPITPSNLEYIAKYGKINGSLLIDLEKAFKEAMEITRDKTLELSASESKIMVIDSRKCNYHSCGRPLETKIIDRNSILSLKTSDKLKIN